MSSRCPKNSALGSPSCRRIVTSSVTSCKGTNPPPTSEFDGGFFYEHHRRDGDAHRQTSRVAFSANRSCGVKPGDLSRQRGRCAPRSGEIQREVR